MPTKVTKYAGYLGFYNRTCSSSLLPSKTAGPVLRRRGNIWEQWVLMDVKHHSEESKTATLMTYAKDGFDYRYVEVYSCMTCLFFCHVHLSLTASMRCIPFVAGPTELRVK